MPALGDMSAVQFRAIRLGLGLQKLVGLLDITAELGIADVPRFFDRIFPYFPERRTLKPGFQNFLNSLQDRRFRRFGRFVRGLVIMGWNFGVGGWLAGPIIRLFRFHASSPSHQST